MAAVLRDQVLNMSLHPYGCRVVQAALQGLPGEHKVALARELEGHIMKVLESQHGNHVVQRIVETVSGLPLRRCCCPCGELLGSIARCAGSPGPGPVIAPGTTKAERYT
jgi:hypothetical protein